MENLLPLMLVATFVIFAVAMTIWTFSRSREILEQWARENGHQLLESNFRWLRKGPFFFTSSKNQMVYYVKVKTPNGQIKTGWVRCGSFFWGILKEKAEVRWDE
ncbi:MAG: hypothetical protein ACYS8Z_17385 [Planctomycetota bacterium]|jgi:hypothetical protein